MNYNSGNENNQSDSAAAKKKERGCSAFYMATRMISIKLCSSSEESRSPNAERVKGRVHVYDDNTKTLILKIWSDSLQQYTGLGVFNTQNVILDKIHVLQDLDLEDDSNDVGSKREEAVNEFSVGENAYNRMIMEGNHKTC